MNSNRRKQTVTLDPMTTGDVILAKIKGVLNRRTPGGQLARWQRSKTGPANLESQRRQREGKNRASGFLIPGILKLRQGSPETGGLGVFLKGLCLAREPRGTWSQGKRGKKEAPKTTNHLKGADSTWFMVNSSLRTTKQSLLRCMLTTLHRKVRTTEIFRQLCRNRASACLPRWDKATAAGLSERA